MKPGKHIVCEKAVTMNVEELDAILKLAKETGKTFRVQQNRRWTPDFLITRELTKINKSEKYSKSKRACKGLMEFMVIGAMN